MDITDYTSYAEIRSAIGLSSVELPDDLLAMEMYQNVLQLRLREVNLPAGAPGTGLLDSRFLAIVATAESSRSETEQKLYALTRLYATYVVAHEVAMSLSMRAPKQESDGKRTLVRFSPESTYEVTAGNMKAQVEDLKLQIENIVEAALSIPQLFSAVGPGVNVVTNS